MNRIRFYQVGLWLILFIPIIACSQQAKKQKETSTADFSKLPPNSSAAIDTATFAAGCFWCVEAQFQVVDGVQSVTSGYIGGKVKNPTYKQVSSGNTGHAEAINIVFDPKIITFDELLEMFFLAHDPTQLNRQGNDVGTQYRSAIFVHSKAQLDKVNYYIKKLNEEKVYDKPLVTQVEPYGTFYKAEDYHQEYYLNNGGEAYCQYVIQPKLEKFKKVFSNKLKN
ncbi:peptide-methionine (S)-S-oxide reductase MsrA [Sphingobacterium hungaricum]|uniref:Peptide methionine sulfoxide reductase MsrA n=1 Tax=Sphingobacterium hungaricum TaxID=2082723 RepID=A0A928UVJ8_9SPHI|nr:peptide-methionine (S)-S-oxide reductase MsrA [Sphingobacterium hungaricum]MBE8713512.1 peptide-methionine (S)-S-oxide reductase [Sphingobacterium hungaricum]